MVGRGGWGRGINRKDKRKYKKQGGLGGCEVRCPPPAFDGNSDLGRVALRVYSHLLRAAGFAQCRFVGRPLPQLSSPSHGSLRGAGARSRPQHLALTCCLPATSPRVLCPPPSCSSTGGVSCRLSRLQPKDGIEKNPLRIRAPKTQVHCRRKHSSLLDNKPPPRPCLRINTNQKTTRTSASKGKRDPDLCQFLFLRGMAGHFDVTQLGIGPKASSSPPPANPPSNDHGTDTASSATGWRPYPPTPWA